MRLASATISSERLFSKLEGLSAIARVEPGAKIAALQPFLCDVPYIRSRSLHTVVSAFAHATSFEAWRPKIWNRCRCRGSLLACHQGYKMRDRMRLGGLIAKAVDEACYRQKENCSGDSDRYQPAERHSPVVPTRHRFLPYAMARGLLATQRAAA